MSYSDHIEITFTYMLKKHMSHCLSMTMRNPYDPTRPTMRTVEGSDRRGIAGS